MAALADASFQFGDRNAKLRIGLKDHAKELVNFVRQWQNRLQETTVPEISTVGRVLNRSLLPWVASTSQVHEDDTKGPDIIGGRPI